MAGKSGEFSIHVLNPRKKRGKKRGKKRTRARKAKPTMAKKKRRRRRKNPGSGYVVQSSNPRRRRSSRRRRRNPARRRGGGGGGMLGTLLNEAKSAIPRIFGKIIVSTVAQRFGYGSIFPGSATTSPTYGNSWSGQQYGAAILTAALIGKFGGRWGSEMRRGAVDLIVAKFAYTELIARVPMAQSIFGQTEGQVRVDPSTGQTWYFQNGQWNAMQGYGDTLVSASPYDDTLVSASPLDGLVASSPLDAAEPDYQYQSLYPSYAGASEDSAAKFHRLYAV